MIERFGAERCNKEVCKEAMKQLTTSGRLVYTFYDGSYIEMPSEERRANEAGSHGTAAEAPRGGQGNPGSPAAPA